MELPKAHARKSDTILSGCASIIYLLADIRAFAIHFMTTHLEYEVRKKAFGKVIQLNPDGDLHAGFRTITAQ